MQKFIDLVLRGKDLLSGKTDDAAGSINELKTEIKELDKELKQVEQTQANIDTFNALTEEAKGLEKALAETEAELSKFSSEQASASAKVEKASSSYKELAINAKALETTYKNQTQSLSKNNTSLERTTIKMREQADAVKSTEQAIAATNKSYTEQQKRLQALETEYKSTKQPVDDLNNSYKIAKAQLSALEQVQKRQATELEKTKSAYTQSADEVARLTKSQASFKQAIDTTKTALGQTADELSKLEKEQKESNEQLTASTRNYTATGKAVNKFNSDLTKVDSSLTKVKSKLKSSGVDTENLANETEKLASKQNKLAASSKQAFSSLTKVTTGLKGVKDAANKADNGIAGVTRNLIALAATYVGIDTLKNRLVDMFTTGDKFEKLNQQLVAVMGSIESGEQASKWIKDFTKTVPFGVEQVTDSFLRLKNFGLDPMDGSLQAIVDLNEKLGGGQERLSGISLALGQAWAKQKFQGEEILQLIERGVPVWSLLEKVTGKNTLELQKLSSAGKLGRDTIKLLIEEIGKSSQGEAAKGMSRLSGIISNSKDRLDEFYDLISTSGAMDWLKNQVSQLNTQFDEMAQNGQLQVWAKNISQAIIDIGNGVKTTISALVEYKDEIATVAKAWAVLKVGSFFLNVLSGAKAAGLALTAFATRLGVISTVSATASTGVGLLAGVTLNLANVLKGGLIAATIASVAQIGRLGVAVYDLITAKQELAKAEDFSAEQQQKGIEKLKEFNKEHGLTFKSMKEAIAAMDSGTIVLDEVTGKYITAAEAQQKLGEASKLTAEQIANQIASAELNGVAIEKANQKAAQQISLLKEQSNASSRLTAEVKSNAQAISDAERALQKNILAGKSTAEIDKQLIKLYGEKTKLTQDQAKANQDLKNSTEQLNTKYGEGLVKIQGYKAELDQLELRWKSGSIGITEYTNAKDLLNRQIDLLLPSLSAEQQQLLGTIDSTERVIKLKKDLQNLDNKGKNLTQEQTEQQEELNKANAAAESHAGANVAFQKLWNEAKERSIQLYDLTALSVENLTDRTKELGSELSNAFRTQSWSNILKPINDLNNAAKQNEIQAIAQEKAYRALFAQLENGSLSLKQLEHFSREASEQFDQLADTRLDALQNQIEIAKNATRELKNELTDTLTDLQNELDNLEGNQQAVIRRNYEADKQELQVKLEQARKSGDTQAIDDAKAALAIQKEIFALKTAEAQIETVSTTKTVSENSNTNTNIQEVRNVQDIRYTVTFKAGNTSATFNEGGKNVEQLLQYLQDAGLTVTRG